LIALVLGVLLTLPAIAARLVPFTPWLYPPVEERPMVEYVFLALLIVAGQEHVGRFPDEAACRRAVEEAQKTLPVEAISDCVKAQLRRPAAETKHE
jgi:hypothetical protein